MALSRTLIDVLEAAPYQHNEYGPVVKNRRLINFQQNTLFNRYLDISLRKEELENFYLPVILYNRQDILDSLDTSPDIIRLMCPLWVQQKVSRRTNQSVLTSLLTTDQKVRLTQVTTSKGGIYYGGSSLVLNKDFQFIFTFMGRITLERRVSRRDLDVKLVLHPRVFIENTDPIHKMILSHVVPHVLSTQEIKIEVEDLDSWIKTPSVPVKGINDDEINNFLITHADEILNVS
jgi:hypothetical protein